MTYSVDSNIIIDLFLDNEYTDGVVETLFNASNNGTLIACDIVWAEASSHIGNKTRFQSVMTALGIGFSPMPQVAALRAGEMWNRARTSQKKTKDVPRQAVVPDFLIGAHALECADALITRDRGFLRKWFSGLRIIDPTEEKIV